MENLNTQNNKETVSNNLILQEIFSMKREIDAKLEEQNRKREEDKAEQDRKREVLEGHVNTQLTLINQREINANARMNHLDTRMDNIEAAMHQLREDMRSLGKKKAETINIKSILPDPAPNEIEIVLKLLSGETDNSIKSRIRDLGLRTIGGIIDAGIDCGLQTFYEAKKKAKVTLSEDNNQELKQEFFSSFIKTFENINGTSWQVELGALGAKLLVSGIKYCVEMYGIHKDEKEREEHTEHNSFGFKEVIKGYLKENTEEYFEEFLKLHQEYSYRSFGGREDLSEGNNFSKRTDVANYRIFQFTEFNELLESKRNLPDEFNLYLPRDSMFDSLVEKAKATESLREKSKIDRASPSVFSNLISGFLNGCGVDRRVKSPSIDYVNSSPIVHPPRESEPMRIIENHEDMIKDDLTEEQKKDLEYRFKYYRAHLKISEFAEVKKCDNIKSKKEGLTSAGLSIIPPIGIAVGSIYLAKRIAAENTWGKNKKALMEIMRRCIERFDRKVMEKTIEEFESVVRVKTFILATNSKFTEAIMNEIDEWKYRNIKEGYREIFDTAFYIYSRVANKGVADRANFLDYDYSIANLGGQQNKGIFDVALSVFKNAQGTLGTLIKQNNQTEEVAIESVGPNGEKIKTVHKYTEVPAGNGVFVGLGNLVGGMEQMRATT